MFNNAEASQRALAAFSSFLFFIISSTAAVIVIIFSDFQKTAQLANLVLPTMSIYFLIGTVLNYRKFHKANT
ncbi:MAG: hypothetical protein Q4C74_09535 [Rothia sp. (in: high G+C Gram-positive bacteria)]|nr:hypothetical protein [Rothia sp. (in: high G+C Gram-positive bacteria)]